MYCKLVTYMLWFINDITPSHSLPLFPGLLASYPGYPGYEATGLLACLVWSGKTSCLTLA